VVAEQGGLLGEITTVRIGETDTVRDITIETSDDNHTRRVIDAVRQLKSVELMQTVDRVFECHRGGKLHLRDVVEVQRHDED
jgi:malate dehydrogenase (oxaloacetate-decarboxylating)